MERIDANATQQILSFLSVPETRQLAHVSMQLRNDVEKNRCDVLWYRLWDVDYPQYNGCETLEYFPTKETAMLKAQTLKGDAHNNKIIVYHYEATLGFVANRWTWKIEWNRIDGVWQESIDGPQR